MIKSIRTIAIFFAGAVLGSLALVSSTGQASTGHHGCDLSSSNQRAAVQSLKWIAAQDVPARQGANAYPALHMTAQRATATLAQFPAACR